MWLRKTRIWQDKVVANLLMPSLAEGKRKVGNEGEGKEKRKKWHAQLCK